MMFHGFIRNRERVTKRYPMFYIVTDRELPVENANVHPKKWTRVARVLADACYFLWMQMVMLEYLTLVGGLALLEQQADLDKWYEFPGFVAFCKNLTQEAILKAAKNPQNAIPYTGDDEPGLTVLDYRDLDMPIIRETLEWKIIIKGPTIHDEEDVVYDIAAKHALESMHTFQEVHPRTPVTTVPGASIETVNRPERTHAHFTQSAHFSTVKEVAQVLDDAAAASGVIYTGKKDAGLKFAMTIFTTQVEAILEALVELNPAGKLTDKIMSVLSGHAHDECRCDAFVYLLIHVAVFTAVMSAERLHVDAMEIMLMGSPALDKFERQYLTVVLKRVASMLQTNALSDYKYTSQMSTPQSSQLSQSSQSSQLSQSSQSQGSQPSQLSQSVDDDDAMQIVGDSQGPAIDPPTFEKVSIKARVEFAPI